MIKTLYSRNEHPSYFGYVIRKQIGLFSQKTFHYFDIYKYENNELELYRPKAKEKIGSIGYSTQRYVKNFPIFEPETSLYLTHEYLEPMELERFIFLKNLRRKKSGVIMMKSKLKIENNG